MSQDRLQSRVIERKMLTFKANQYGLIKKEIGLLGEVSQ
jgi:hypothetical protein